MSKMRRTRQGGKRGKLLPELVACQLPFTEFFDSSLPAYQVTLPVGYQSITFVYDISLLSKDSIPLSDFFDSSCYENSKYGILIAAARGHRYENSAVHTLMFPYQISPLSA